MTILMGRNGSGKSMLLRAWRDLMPDTTHYVVPERTGDFGYEPQWLNEELDRSRRRRLAAGNSVNGYRQRIVARVQAYLLQRGAHRGVGEPPVSPSELESLLAILVLDLDVRLLAGGHPLKLTRVVGNSLVDDVDQLSSGEAQLLMLGLDVLTMAAMWELEQRAVRIMLIDEPDAHLHPDLQVRFADFMMRAMARFGLQLVLATHSVSMLAAFSQLGGAKCGLAHLHRESTYCDVRPVDEVARELASCLGGHVLMGHLFGAPILLVEGDDDYRIWSQVPRHHNVNISVVPCDGDKIDKYQRTLERMLGSLREQGAFPLGYALRDGDTTLPQDDSNTPQRFIKYVSLACRESENLYLTDAVLESLGHTWSSACDALEAAAKEEKFGSKSAMLSGCRAWARISEDIKPYIGEIERTLDEKRVAWQMRVGRAIGRQLPEGELREFLGSDVVDALWRHARSQRVG